MNQTAFNDAMRTVSGLTVDRMKWILRAINLHPHWRSAPPQKLSGLKANLLDRIKLCLISAFDEGDQNRFSELTKMVRDSGAAVRPIHPSSSHSNGNPPQTAYQRENIRLAAQQQALRQAQVQRAQIEAERHARMQNYQQYPQPPPPQPPVHAPAAAPLPPPRWGPGSVNGAAPNAGPPANGSSTPFIPIRFRPNPFYRIEKSLSAIATCVRAGQGDRKTVQANFALTQPQINLLAAAVASPTATQYQVRLFSTNEEHFNQSRATAAQHPVPIDFPPVVEVRLNNTLVVANMKGLKKQIGSAPPANLSSTTTTGGSLALSLAPAYINKVEIVYGNAEKKYFLIVYLVEVFSIKTLFTKLKTHKIRTKEEVIASIVKQNSDPDIEASSMGLSLKDPLTLARIKVPIRSILCNHISCFDAETFLTLNHQTPSWKCPTCDNVLVYEDLTVDGYLQDILKLCPSSVDEVTVEPDGRWRSTDNQHGTAPPRPSRAGTEDLLNAANEKGKAKAADQDSLTLDSDDDERPLIRNRALHLDNSRPNSRGSTEAPRRADTIDLTLSDSEDEQDDVVLYNARTVAPVVTPVRPQPAAMPARPRDGNSSSPFDQYGDVRAQYIEESMEMAAVKRQTDEAEGNLAKRQRGFYD